MYSGRTGSPHTPVWAVGPTARVTGPRGKKGAQMAGYVIRPVKYGQGTGRALQRGLGRAPEVCGPAPHTLRPDPARPQPGSSAHSRDPHDRARSEASAHLDSSPRARAFGLRRHGNHSPGRRGCDVAKAAGALLPTSRRGAAQLRASARPRFPSFLGLHHSAPLLLIFLHSLIHFFTGHQVARGIRKYTWSFLRSGPHFLEGRL